MAPLSLLLRRAVLPLSGARRRFGSNGAQEGGAHERAHHRGAAAGLLTVPTHAQHAACMRGLRAPRQAAGAGAGRHTLSARPRPPLPQALENRRRNCELLNMQDKFRYQEAIDTIRNHHGNITKPSQVSK